jgi:hypothetical protein
VTIEVRRKKDEFFSTALRERKIRINSFFNVERVCRSNGRFEDPEMIASACLNQGIKGEFDFFSFNMQDSLSMIFTLNDDEARNAFLRHFRSERL